MTDAFGGSSWVDLAGYLACLLVFLSFSMKSLLPLRVIAIASNVVFIIYSFAAQELPMLLLHGALLPLNIFRTAEQIKFFRQVRKSARGDIEVDALIPFMRPVSHSAGSYLFQKGDPASIIYYLSEGTVQIPEINKPCLRARSLARWGRSRHNASVQPRPAASRIANCRSSATPTSKNSA